MALRATASSLLAAAAGLAACASLPGSTGMTPDMSVHARRPQLSDAQAAAYSRRRVLAAAGRAGALVEDGWDPLADPVITGGQAPRWDYRVDAATADGRTTFATVQGAVNRAHTDALADAAAGRPLPARRYIGIAPGDYPELVYVPSGPVPLTLWGQGADATQVRIHDAIDGGLPAAEYIARQAPVYEAPAMHPDIVAFYRACSRQPTITTGCTAVMWVRANGFQLRNVTVDNRYDQSRGGAPRQPGGLHQAVAFKAEGADRLQLEQVRLLGHQDTLYLAAGAPDQVVRSFIHRSLVAGDVDFIFGPATAYFLASEIRFVGGLRQAASGYVAAPSTPLGVPYGLVFDDCDFTSAGGGQLVERQAVFLARQWFSGARCSPYGPSAGSCSIAPKDSASNDGQTLGRTTLEAVGKMVVLRSRLGAHLQPEAPWSPWQADPAARNHRPVQYGSDDFWRLLQAAGKDPDALGYPRRTPPEPFLAEYRNTAGGPSAIRR